MRLATVIVLSAILVFGFAKGMQFGVARLLPIHHSALITTASLLLYMEALMLVLWAMFRVVVMLLRKLALALMMRLCPDYWGHVLKQASRASSALSTHA